MNETVMAKWAALKVTYWEFLLRRSQDLASLCKTAIVVVRRSGGKELKRKLQSGFEL